MNGYSTFRGKDNVWFSICIMLTIFAYVFWCDLNELRTEANNLEISYYNLLKTNKELEKSNKDLKEKFKKLSYIKPNTAQINCLAKNIYFEARGEPIVEQIAVGMVTRNRTKSNVYPTTYCGVVYQKCQFSWTLNKSNYVNTKSIVWKRIYNLATKIYTRKIIKDPSKGATHYYAHELIRSPIWARGVKPTIKLEAHTYLKLV